MKRFFTTVLYVALLSFVFSSGAISQEKFGGVALYTVREQMSENPKETLKAIANLGYKNIEVAGYENGKFYGMEPEAFKTYVESLGLVPLSVHMGGVTLENADEQIADAKKVGFTYFVIPIPPMGHFKYDPQTQKMSMSNDVEFITEFLNTVGKKCEEAGMELLYHNHDFEFRQNENGIVPMDYFLENTNPAYVNFQLDLYWITKAEKDPVFYFEKYLGRFKTFHVKDMDEEGRFAPVGEGKINFKRIAANSKMAGARHYFVEQDATFEHEPLEALKISRAALKDINFEKYMYKK